jgi:C-terminal processing protease CtpA/Prc
LRAPSFDIERSSALGSHGALANDVLLRFRLLIDYPHERLFVLPVERKPDASASFARVGVSLRFGTDGCPEIRQITDTNAPVTLEKLRIGDVLVAIDGRHVCEAWHHEISAALAGPAGTRKQLRLRRGGDTIDVEVLTAELLQRQ